MVDIERIKKKIASYLKKNTEIYSCWGF